jgi:hypothetical protein
MLYSFSTISSIAGTCSCAASMERRTRSRTSRSVSLDIPAGAEGPGSVCPVAVLAQAQSRKTSQILAASSKSATELGAREAAMGRAARMRMRMSR